MLSYETWSADFPIQLSSLDLGHDEAMVEAQRVGRDQMYPHTLACWVNLGAAPLLMTHSVVCQQTHQGLLDPAASNS